MRTSRIVAGPGCPFRGRSPSWPHAELLRFGRAGNPGAGDQQRGGGRADLRRLRREPARGVPGQRPRVPGHGGRGGRAPALADRRLRAEVRQPHPAGAAPGRARRGDAQAGMANPPAGHRRRAPPCPADGDRRQPFLRRGRGPQHRRLDSQAAGRPGRGRDRAPARRQRHRGGAPVRRRAGAGGRGRPPAVHPAHRAAGLGRADGWVGLHLGAGVRRRLRHRQQPRRFPGRRRQLGRRGHLDGVRGGAGRRRQAVGPRHAVRARGWYAG